MAYSPLGQGDLLAKRALKSIAASAGVTPAQLALAFVLAQDGVVAIPKASDLDHLRENVAALSVTLDGSTRASIDAAFPAPRGPVSISIV